MWRLFDNYSETAKLIEGSIRASIGTEFIIKDFLWSPQFQWNFLNLETFVLIVVMLKLGLKVVTNVYLTSNKNYQKKINENLPTLSSSCITH